MPSRLKKCRVLPIRPRAAENEVRASALVEDRAIVVDLIIT
jgi:hypothetical protein